MGPRRECPDYSTAGPHSCHFDGSHTTVWSVYCMNVTAVTAARNYTSQQLCLDVADIVETEVPVNLTFELSDAGGDETGHNALLSWRYPEPGDLQYGWITLVYELQYRRVGDAGNWKVKPSLREPQVELLSLPVGDYVVRVRCRSKNSPLWSKWSALMPMRIPAGPTAGKLLVQVLVAGFGIGAALVVAFIIIPQSKRIKDFLLPPIPKPRIMGINPLLLKKGNLDEINVHLSSFHSYRPPSYSQEVWEPVNEDKICLTLPDRADPASPVGGECVRLMAACHLAPVFADRECPTAYVQGVPPYGPALTSDPAFPPQGAEYTTLGQLGAAGEPAAATKRSPQDFYTCVQQMNDSGEVHLVPCLPPEYCRDLLPPPWGGEKKDKMADRQLGMDSGEAGSSGSAHPLGSVAVDNRG
ncbi:unnamed protein product [Tetraodon nigroviridis]|uniref:(spotted green pufferfish) hypothetical protein n=1 Tax=Tetraodon nigroviridis TaxID=99883 RepID=Q4SEQ9_TETNG|nr:unnamed protein product [Tetraodon nigroviridis]